MSRLKINDKFKPLYEQPSNVRYYIVTGGRGSSKSFSVGTWSCLKTFEQYVKILYTRFTLTSAELSIIPEFEEKIDILNINDKLEVRRKSISNIMTGSEIMFSGIKTSSGNQTANLKSLQGVNVWILDEAEEETDESRFDKIDLSVRDKKNKNIIILILNPATKEHWIYKRFFEEKGVPSGWNGIKDDTCYIHTTYLDNVENLSDTFLQRVEYIKEHKPDKYKHEILGGWREKVEGVIFTDWEYGQMDESLPRYRGLDFGFKNDPDGCVEVAIDEKRMKIYVKEVFYNYRQTIDELSYQMKKLGKLPIVADSAEQRLINHLAVKTGHTIFPVKKKPGSVIQGIRIMENYQIVVCGESPNLVRELNNYCWSQKDAPIDDYNHLIDSIRYVVWTFGKLKYNENKDTRSPKRDKSNYDSAPWVSNPEAGGKATF